MRLHHERISRNESTFQIRHNSHGRVVRRAREILSTETIREKGEYKVKITYLDLKGKKKIIVGKGLYTRHLSN